MLLTSILAVSVAALAGCDSAEIDASYSAEVSVEKESSSAGESTSSEEASKETENSKENEDSATTENSTTESSAAPESSTVTDSAETADTSAYIGMTVSDFIAAGNEHSGYMGFNGNYTFSAKNEETKTMYSFTLSDDVADIMDKKEFGEDYEDLIGECTIVEMELQVADDAKIEAYVGKTLTDLSATGITVNGHMTMGNAVTLIGADGLLPVYIEYGKDGAAVVNALNDPDSDEIAEALKDCPIESIYYMLY